MRLARMPFFSVFAIGECLCCVYLASWLSSNAVCCWSLCLFREPLRVPGPEFDLFAGIIAACDGPAQVRRFVEMQTATQFGCFALTVRSSDTRPSLRFGTSGIPCRMTSGGLPLLTCLANAQIMQIQQRSLQEEFRTCHSLKSNPVTDYLVANPERCNPSENQIGGCLSRGLHADASLDSTHLLESGDSRHGSPEPSVSAASANASNTRTVVGPGPAAAKAKRVHKYPNESDTKKLLGDR